MSAGKVDVLAVDGAVSLLVSFGARRESCERQARPWSRHHLCQARQTVLAGATALRLLVSTVRAYRAGPQWLANDEVPGLLEVICEGRRQVAKRRAALARIGGAA